MPALFFLANAGQNLNGMGSSSKNTSVYKQRPSYINKSITPKHTIPLKTPLRKKMKRNERNPAMKPTLTL